MFLLVLIAVVLLARIGIGHGWPGAATVSRWWSGHREQAHALVHRSPATFSYLAILTVTTWVLVGASPGVVDALLREQSTNLSHLGRDPIRVLVRSAFWLSNYELLFWAVLFVAVLAPAERWLGTGRWLAAFVAGHVGATMLTAIGVWLAVRSGFAPHSLETAVDVGVSYGFAAVAALFTYRLPGRWRWIWASGLALYVVGRHAAGRQLHQLRPRDRDTDRFRAVPTHSLQRGAKPSRGTHLAATRETGSRRALRRNEWWIVPLYPIGYYQGIGVSREHRRTHQQPRSSRRLQDNDIVLVDFWASWCGPCRMFAPVFEKAAAAHPDIVFGKVDTEAEQSLAGAAGISSIPTLMAFREGVLVFSQPGALPAPALEQVIDAVMALDMADVHAKVAARSS